ncbi:MAG: MCE family protein [Proteobacteria bacterium]|nr:MCE family protein [Pseudomonadota bacterium]
MENRAHAIVAICFLVVFTIAAVLIFLWLSSGPGEPLSYRIVTRESVAGLAPQSKVEFKGIEVGHVQQIHFDPRDRARVIVDFTVRQDTYVTHATYAVLTLQGLTGGEVLELKLGQGSNALLATSSKNPALIPLRKGLLAQLEDSAQQDMQDLHAVLGGAREILSGGNRKHLAATIRQLDAATAQLVAIETALQPTLQRMPALVQSTQQSLDESHALLANVNTLAEQARGPVRKLGTVEDTYRNLGHTLDAQTGPDLDALSQSLLRTSQQLQDLLRELKARPQSVIFGPPPSPPGPGEPGFRARDDKDSGHD